MAETRENRELSTRAKAEHRPAWRRPETLPSPNPEPGYEFHWVRVSSNGTVDAMNVSSKLREGWVPVKAEDHPEITVVAIENQRFADNIVIGGLLLCKAPKELVHERNAFYAGQADQQMRSVDNNLMRENDDRMPLFNNRETQVEFGKGK